MNIKKDTKNLQALLNENRDSKNGDIAIREFHKMHEYIIKLEAKTENLIIDIVSDCDQPYMKWWYDLSDCKTDDIIIKSGVRKPITEDKIKELYKSYR